MTLTDAVLSNIDLNAKAALVALRIMIEFCSVLECDKHRPR